MKSKGDHQQQLVSSGLRAVLVWFRDGVENKTVQDVTEALLEMHFHRAIVKLFEETFGAKFLRLLKPSTKAEVWVGFDQGWTHSSLTSSELFDQLKAAIPSGKTSVNAFYFGYFMQFKSVQQMRGLSKYAPPSFSVPYYRAEVSLEVNEKTGLSQHETLTRLCKISGSDVNYVCPMMADIDELYDEPNVDQLQIVDVRSAPVGWGSTDRHFIAFQSLAGASPQWCSEPVLARAHSARAWLESAETRPVRKTAAQVLELVEAASEALAIQRTTGEESQGLPLSLTLVEFAEMASIA